VVKSISKPDGGLTENVPPGVSIVGEAVDMSLTQ